MSLKITTFNICGGVDFENRIQDIADYLGQQNSDVVCLQEVRLNPERSPYSQAKILNGLLGFEYMSESITRYYVTSQDEAFREGLAILSKYPLSNIEGYTHKKMPDDKHQRIALLTDVETPEGKVQLANVHFSNNQHSESQLEELFNIFTARDEQRIVVGDFNMPPDVVTRLAGTNYQSSYDFTKYVSYPSKSETLDYALIPKKYTYTSVSVDDENLSDHTALTVELS